jgi:hypothetical protein
MHTPLIENGRLHRCTATTDRAHDYRKDGIGALLRYETAS